MFLFFVINFLLFFFFCYVCISLNSKVLIFYGDFVAFIFFYIIFKFFKNSELDTHGCFVAGERDCVRTSMGTL